MDRGRVPGRARVTYDDIRAVACNHGYPVAAAVILEALALAE